MESGRGGGGGEMTLRRFVQENQDELREMVTRLCPNTHPLSLKDLEEWVVNDEGLYRWALSEGWRG